MFYQAQLDKNDISRLCTHLACSPQKITCQIKILTLDTDQMFLLYPQIINRYTHTLVRELRVFCGPGKERMFAPISMPSYNLIHIENDVGKTKVKQVVIVFQIQRKPLVASNLTLPFIWDLDHHFKSQMHIFYYYRGSFCAKASTLSMIYLNSNSNSVICNK